MVLNDSLFRGRLIKVSILSKPVLPDAKVVYPVRLPKNGRMFLASCCEVVGEGEEATEAEEVGVGTRTLPTGLAGGTFSIPLKSHLSTYTQFLYQGKRARLLMYCKYCTFRRLNRTTYPILVQPSILMFTISVHLEGSVPVGSLILHVRLCTAAHHIRVISCIGGLNSLFASGSMRGPLFASRQRSRGEEASLLFRIMFHSCRYC